VHIREGGAGPDDELLVEFAAGWLVTYHRVVRDMVVDQQLVHYGQVPLVPGLFNKTSGESLILFC
jgi:hypothetical protein